MVRKLLVLGLICLVVSAGAVAYISDFGIGELFAPGPPAPPPKVQLPPKPAYLDKDIATLEAPLEQAIEADLSSITQFQDTRRWLSEQEPLIPTKDLVEGKESLQEVVDYRMRVVDAYRKGTKDPKEAQKAAGVFLERYAQAAATLRGDFKAIRELGDAAIKAGSTDPFVVAYHARAKHNLKELVAGDAYTAYKKVLDELGDGTYPPPILRFQLMAWNADLATQTALAGVPGLLMRQLAYQEAAKFLAQESGKANPAVLLSFVQSTLRFDNSSPEQRAELFQACLSEPKIDPYIHHMLGGEHYLKLAWAARGDGYANTVSGEGWKKFGELMPRAARHFRRAWYLRPENPYAAQRMIMITRAGGDESWLPEDWFHASLVAQFDYHEAYDSYMFISMPRWGGSHLKIASFAKDCIATGRWYTNVPNEAAQAIRLISADSPAGELAGKNPAAEQIASAYIDGFSAAKEKGEVKPEDFADMLATMTSILVQAENFKQARKAFDIGPESNDWWWSIDRDVGYRYSMGLSYAITGPAEESIKPVHEFLTREAVEAPSVADVEAMQKRLEDARAADSNEKAAGFYDIAGRMLGQLKAYAAGEWVDLTFDKSMTLWISRAAGYDMIDEKTLRLTGKVDSACMQMKPLTRFAPPFIVEAEIKMVSAASGDPKPGIVIGAAQVRTRSQPALPQLLAAGPTITGYFQYRQQKGIPSAVDFHVDPEAPGDGFQHLGVRRYVGETDMFAMHGLMTADRNDEPANDFIMFGDLERFTGVTGEAIFRNIRIRKALLTPGLDTENPEKLPVFFQAVDYYPECPEARKQLAGALSEQGRPADALEHLAKAKAVYRKIVDLHRIDGVALCGTGKFEPALAAFREDYRLFPHALWSRIHEAWMLSTAPDEKLRDRRKAQEILDFVKSTLGERGDAWSLRMTEAAVAAENGKVDEAKEFARQGEESADTALRRGIAERIRLAIDQGRPYRMPESGEIPPPPAGRPVKKPKPDPATEKTEPAPAAESEPKAQ